MSLELITGKAEGPHISSFEQRAFNRGLFGPYKYRLNSEPDSPFSFAISPGGTALICTTGGSMMWNGMHIRQTEPDTGITIGSSRERFGLYVEYSRTSDATVTNGLPFVEDVSWVKGYASEYDETSVSTVNLSGFFSDNIVRIRTLFAIIDCDNTQIYSVDYKFPIIRNSSETENNVTLHVYQEQRNRYAAAVSDETNNAGIITARLASSAQDVSARIYPTTTEPPTGGFLEEFRSKLGAAESLTSASEVLFNGHLKFNEDKTTTPEEITLPNMRKLSDFKSIGFFTKSASAWIAYDKYEGRGFSNRAVAMANDRIFYIPIIEYVNVGIIAPARYWRLNKIHMQSSAGGRKLKLLRNCALEAKHSATTLTFKRNSPIEIQKIVGFGLTTE